MNLVEEMNSVKIKDLKETGREILADEKGFLSFPEEGIFRGEDQKISENL